MAEVLRFPSDTSESSSSRRQDAPPDATERSLALDTSRSFLVQAPAGSGKTYLLTQRFLRLLGQAEKPDEIVAITFTNAAAAEMRHRILAELEKADEAGGTLEMQDDPESLPALAQRALKRADQLGWQILDQPSQLRITTIDAFCRSLALQCPLSWGVLSGLGGRLEPVNNPKDLYRRAAAQTMERLLSDEAQAESPADCQSMGALMLWRDNNWKDVEELLVEMLAARNRWYQDFVFDREVDWTTLRVRLEAPFCRAARKRLERLARLLDVSSESRDRALALARFACNQGGKSIPSGLAQLAEFPEWVVEEAEAEEADLLEDAVAAYRELAGFLLTQKSGWRSVRGLTVHYGFPSTPEGKAAKERFGELVDDLAKAEGLHAALAAFQSPIPTRYSEEEWELIQHCFAILRAAAVELQLVFAETGSVDFTEVAQIALRVMAPQDGLPSEFAMRQAAGIRHLLVDEFQDTSRNQHQLLARLVAAWPEREGRSCFCVGDPMQSIYAFREAEVELFERLKTRGLENSIRDYFAADWLAEPFRFEFVSLRSNFRTVPSLVKDLNAHFSKIFAEDDESGVRFAEAEPARTSPSQARTELHLAFTRKSRSAEVAADHQVGEAESTRAAQLTEIVELVRSRLAACSDPRTRQDKYRIALLGRTRKSLILIAEALRAAGIRYRAIDLVSLAQTAEVLDVLAMARALLNPADRIAWLGVLRAPWCGLTLEELYWLTSADDAAILETPVPVLIETRLRSLFDEGLLQERAFKAAARVGHVIRDAVETRPTAGAWSLGTWLEAVWKALGGESTVNSEQRENLRVLWQALDTLPTGELDILGPELQSTLEDLYAQPDPAASSDFGVQLMTIHKSKGLEFEVVIVPDLEVAGKMYSRSLVSWLERGLVTSDSDQVTEFLVGPIQGKGEEAGPAKKWVDLIKRERERQELRRLLYVAATRAREELHLFARPRYTENKEAEGGAPTLDRPTGLLATAFPALGAEIESRFAAWIDQCSPVGSNNTNAALVAALAAEADKAEITSEALNEDSRSFLEVARPTILRRLPEDFLPPRFLSPNSHEVSTTAIRGDSGGRHTLERSAESEKAFGDQGGLFARTEGGLQSRLEGIAIHLLLERLAVLRADRTPEHAIQELAAMLPTVTTTIRSHGLPDEEAHALVEQALAVVQQAAIDPVGAWILAPHHYAGVESRWTGIFSGQARNLRPDRVFVASWPTDLRSRVAMESPFENQDFWWIVDYKTTRGSGEDLSDHHGQQSFLATFREKHKEQLGVYAELLRSLLNSGVLTAQGKDLPVRAGVYYPRLRLFDSWEA